MSTGPIRQRRRRGRQGAAFVAFLLIAMPLVMFGAVLAVDFTRMIVSAREISNAAEAAAVAGAQQFQPNTWRLEPGKAKVSAEGAVDFAESRGAIRSTVNTRVASVSPTPHGERVTVTVDYTIEGLVFMPVLTAVLGGGEHSGSERLTITRTADVCIPGRVNGPTGGYCTRPSLR